MKLKISSPSNSKFRKPLPQWWKPGQSGNPKGSTSDHLVQKRILKLHTATTVAEAFTKMLEKSTAEIRAHLEGDNIPVIEQIVGTALLNDISRKDLGNLERILQRVIGPVPIVTKGEMAGDLNVVYGHREQPKDG